MSNKIDIKNNPLVKEDRFLVHNMKHSHSPTATKVIACWLAMIKKDDKEFFQYSISATELKEILGVDIRASHLREIQKELIGSSMTFFDEDIGEHRSLTILKEIRYNPNTFRLTAIFDSDMIPYFIEFKNGYLKYGIENILLLKSGYLIRLYKICRDEVTKFPIPQKNTHFELGIDDMREAFNIPSSYQYSSHIKKNILDKAVVQFPELTDIAIKYSEKKEGRKVVSVYISVVRKDSIKTSNFNPILKFKEIYINAIERSENFSEEHEYDFYEIGDGYNLTRGNGGKLLLCDDDGLFLPKDEVSEAWEYIFENMERLINKEWIDENRNEWSK